MARGGKRPGAGRKRSKDKAKEAETQPLAHPAVRPYDPVILEQARKVCERLARTVGRGLINHLHGRICT
jgi:hypothetical protein